MKVSEAFHPSTPQKKGFFFLSQCCPFCHQDLTTSFANPRPLGSFGDERVRNGIIKAMSSVTPIWVTKVTIRAYSGRASIQGVLGEMAVLQNVGRQGGNAALVL